MAQVAGVTASSSCCCLCHCTLETAKGQGRHKKFNGRSCASVKAIWQLFAAECDCVQEIQRSFRDELAIICYSCISKANKFDKLQQQLLQLKEEMANILGCNVPAASAQGSSPQPQTPQRKKRPRAPAQSSKRARASVRCSCIYLFITCVACMHDIAISVSNVMKYFNLRSMHYLLLG